MDKISLNFGFHSIPIFHRNIKTETLSFIPLSKFNKGSFVSLFSLTDENFTDFYSILTNENQFLQYFNR